MKAVLVNPTDSLLAVLDAARRATADLPEVRDGVTLGALTSLWVIWCTGADLPMALCWVGSGLLWGASLGLLVRLGLARALVELLTSPVVPRLDSAGGAVTPEPAEAAP
ncbi:MAG: hypothetical protein AB1758_32885, partial [Candidatus Eremiobacterota bacterium]